MTGADDPVGSHVGGYVWSVRPALARLESARQRGKAKTMTETQTRRDSRMSPARAQATTADHPGHPDHPERPDDPGRPRRRPGRPGRVLARLRGLLQAQALLNGTSGAPYDVAFIEDDRRRLSGRRAR